MANVANANGFMPLRALDGSGWQGLVRTYYVPASDGTAIYVGDVVKHGLDSGAAGLQIYGLNCEGMPQVIRVSAGTTGQDIVGVVVGFSPDQDNLMRKHRAASTNRLVYVCPVQNVIFEIQEDALVTPVAAASIGLNAAFTTTAGSATTGVSAMKLDSDSVNTTVTLPLKLLRLVPRVGNAFNVDGAGTDPARFEVMFNTYLEAPNVVGV